MRMWAILLLALPASALAHGGEPHADPSMSGLRAAWSFPPLVLMPLLVSAGLYGAGILRLWSRTGVGRGVRTWQVLAFAAGWLSLAGALLSPLHRLGERLFIAHMVEHEILMVIGAPLIVLARPLGAMVWALPARGRHWAGALNRSGPVRALSGFLRDPLAATLLHGVALWMWHLPSLYALALSDERLHWLQHVSFLGTAFLFWSAMLRGKAGRLAQGPAVFYLFVTALHSGFLGILLTVAKAPLYPTQMAASAEWRLTPLEDQQLAGLVMWVPAGIVYAGAALWLAGLWINGAKPETAGRSIHGPAKG